MSIFCVANLGRFYCAKLTLKNLGFRSLYCKKFFRGTFFLPYSGFLNTVNASVLNSLETMMPPETGSSSPCYPVFAGTAPAEQAAPRGISGGSCLQLNQCALLRLSDAANSFLSSSALDERVKVMPVARE